MAHVQDPTLASVIAAPTSSTLEAVAPGGDGQKLFKKRADMTAEEKVADNRARKERGRRAKGGSTNNREEGRQAVKKANQIERPTVGSIVEILSTENTLSHLPNVIGQKLSISVD